MSHFALASWAAWAAVVATAALVRNRLYATFVGVLLALHALVAVALAPRFAWTGGLYPALHAAVYVHFALLARPRMRGWLYRAVVSVPAAWFVAGTFLAFPWAIAQAIGWSAPWPWLPFAAALVGLVESSVARETEVDLVLDGAPTPALARHRSARAAASSAAVARPLRVVQITDPHLGAFMSEARLARICARAVARDPDLIVLTGDFLTMESQSDPDVLARALAPLREARGKTFACLGNHDHEALEIVTRGLEAAGVQLLVDEATVVETAAGRVQIVGMDFHFRDRATRIARVCAEHPRAPDALRLVLLHDPGAFAHLPDGEGDLVLSGHTHGGQLGLVRLGLPYTVVSALTGIPDHGLWARGRDRLYVHRGTGHYGFPLRLGVPSEQSVLRVHRAS